MEEKNTVLNDYFSFLYFFLMVIVKKVSKLISVLKSKWVVLFSMLKILEKVDAEILFLEGGKQKHQSIS